MNIKILKILFMLAAYLLATQVSYAQVVTTFAGDGTATLANGVGTGASFHNPSGITSDGNGNLFVTSPATHSIRKIVIATGQVTTLAGSGTGAFSNGFGTGASFYTPSGITSDGSGNLFVADVNNHCIRKIVIATGQVTTFVGTSGSAGFLNTPGSERFDKPFGITYYGGYLFVTEYGNHSIRRIRISDRQVVTVAGVSGMPGDVDGVQADAKLNEPTGITYYGGYLFVTEYQNHKIRKVSSSSGSVITLTGNGGFGSLNGVGTVASFHHPSGITSDGSGNLFVADVNNHRIRKIAIATGLVTTFAGGVSGDVDDTGTDAEFRDPFGITYDVSGNLFVADYGNHKIRKVTTSLVPPTATCLVITPPTGTDNYWMGCTNSDWNTATNWSSGTVPTANDVIYIPIMAANQLVIDEVVTCAKMVVQIGTKCLVNYNAGGKLVIKF